MVSPQKYIVVFKDSATEKDIDSHIQHVKDAGGEVGHRYDSVMKGFSASLPEQLLSSFQGSDIIDYIEPDQVVTTQ